VGVSNCGMVSPSILPKLTTQYPLVLNLEQSLVSLPEEPSPARFDRLTKSAQSLSLSQAQELICQFFLEKLKQYSPHSALQEFKHLFIEPTETVHSTLRQALDFIISSGSEETFIYTLKRSIYILVNNWSSGRQQQYVQQLVQLLSTSPNPQNICTVTLKRLLLWRRNFVHSPDYQELKLFAAKYENRHKEHWSQRYSAFLLVSQAVDPRKPLEQQEAALTYSKQLKERFKFELAMYTARSSSTACQQSSPPNPTSLGADVLRLIQNILKKRSHFSYVSLARLFLNQTQGINYKDFKQNFLNYLLFSTDNQGLAEAIKTQLASQLTTLYQINDNQPWNNSLMLRTSKRIIECLITSDRGNPSLLFILLISQGKTLTLAILLLKIILLCPSIHTHLECCLAQLIQHYKSQSESECQWLIHFLEVIQVTLTIYVEDVQYNLVNMSEYKQGMIANDEETVYRIFSQIKREGKKYPKIA
jgi:hypothetical protein